MLAYCPENQKGAPPSSARATVEPTMPATSNAGRGCRECLITAREKRSTAVLVELRDVGRWWIRVLLHRFEVPLDFFQRGAGHPSEEPSDNEILVRVHLDVVDLRICHGC